MNIFVLDENPALSAKYHCDRHIVKMVVEYAQMLSTAHRLLDGAPWVHERTFGGKTKQKKLYLLADEGWEVADNGKFKIVDAKCYAATHINHPCAIWARTTDANYLWLLKLLDCCLAEYALRYGKCHATSRIREFLSIVPENISQGELMPFEQTMPEEYKSKNAVKAYRQFYNGPKAKFARWTKRDTPEWFTGISI